MLNQFIWIQAPFSNEIVNITAENMAECQLKRNQFSFGWNSESASSKRSSLRYDVNAIPFWIYLCASAEAFVAFIAGNVKYSSVVHMQIFPAYVKVCKCMQMYANGPPARVNEISEAALKFLTNNTAVITNYDIYRSKYTN